MPLSFQKRLEHTHTHTHKKKNSTKFKIYPKSLVAMKEYWYIERDLTTKYWNAQSSSDCFFFFSENLPNGFNDFSSFCIGKSKTVFSSVIFNSSKYELFCAIATMCPNGRVPWHDTKTMRDQGKQAWSNAIVVLKFTNKPIVLFRTLKVRLAGEDF